MKNTYRYALAASVVWIAFIFGHDFIFSEWYDDAFLKLLIVPPILTLVSAAVCLKILPTKQGV